MFAVLDIIDALLLLARVREQLNAQQIDDFSQLVRRVPAAEHLMQYALQLARKTRVGRDEATEMIGKYVSWGAGPRASQYLVLAAKARAALHGRYCVAEEDIAAVAPPVLRHRIITNFNAEAEGIKPDDILIDPLVLTVSGCQEFCPELIEAVRTLQFAWDPPPSISVGLSNVSNAVPQPA